MEKNQENAVENESVEGTETTVEMEVVETKSSVKDETGNDVKTEAQKIADAIVAKKLSKMPSKEELKAFKEWQDSQKTEEQKKEEETKEKLRLADENSNLKKEKLILKKGISDDDVIEFILFKLNKLEGDFEDNLENFLKDNPKYFSSDTIVETTGVPTKRDAVEKVDGVTARLKEKHPNLF